MRYPMDGFYTIDEPAQLHEAPYPASVVVGSGLISRNVIVGRYHHPLSLVGTVGTDHVPVFPSIVDEPLLIGAAAGLPEFGQNVVRAFV